MPDDHADPMTAATSASTTDPEPLTLDQLMEVLQERLEAWLRDHPTANPAAPPLLEWFITDDDVARFVPPKPTERPAPQPIPLRELRRRLEAKQAELAAALQQRDALDAQACLPDRAAARLRPSTARREQERADRQLTELVRLNTRIAKLEHQVSLAAARVRRRQQRDSDPDAPRPTDDEPGSQLADRVPVPDAPASRDRPTPRSGAGRRDSTGLQRAHSSAPSRTGRNLGD